MEKTTLTRLKLELESFKALVIANLIGAALTMAFTIAFGIQNVIPFITGGSLTPDQIPYLLMIIIGGIVAINWIINSAELMDEHDEITKDFDEVIKEHENIIKDLDSVELGDENATTGIIIRSLAFYRDNKENINKLKWGGRITGTFLLVSAVSQLRALLSGTYAFEGFMVIGLWFAIISCVVIGVAAWYVPVIIKRFTETWDARLNFVDDVNKKLERILEDP